MSVTYDTVAVTAELLDDGEIRPGLGDFPLSVEREEIDADTDFEDFDGSENQRAAIGKPRLFEYFTFYPDAVLPTRLLVRPVGNQTVEHYTVVKALRPAISPYMKGVQVIPWYSFTNRGWGLWVQPYNPENPWYESVRALLNKPADYFAGVKFLKESDRAAGRYRFRKYPCEQRRPELGRKVEDLLGEAIGPKGFILTPDHPVYRGLVSGDLVI